MEYSLGPYQIEVATDFGPRVTGLRLEDDDNVFISLPPDVTLGPAEDPFRFMGGHRVWAAPEDPELTYAPDGGPCTVRQDGASVTVSARPDRAGVVKEMTLTAVGGSLSVVNRLMFTKDLGRRLAPWAITQFPYGGTAIIPVRGAETGLLPNRKLVLWPYTSLTDPRLDLREGGAVVDAEGEIPFKIGTSPSPGRLGYWHSGRLFTKEIESMGGREVPDMGTVGQLYVGSGFCELESLGGLSPADEGTVMSLTEVWSIRECSDLDTAVEAVFGAAP